MDFFHNLNKKLADLSAKQDAKQLTESAAVAEASTGDYSAKKAAAGKDIGKPGKMFSKIAKSAGKEYGSKAAGERVAGAVLAKLRKGVKEADMEEGNEFSGELVKARAPGAKEFKVDGKSYPVKEAAKPDYIDLDKDGNRKESMKKAAADKKKMSEADPMGLEEKKKEPRSKGTAFDPEVAKSMFAHKDDSSRYDVKDTGYSKRYTRKPEPEAETDDEVATDAPKKKGRPTGTKRAIGAKGPTGQSKLMSKDSIKEMDAVSLTDKGEYDQEGDMARDQLHTLVKAAKELHGILADDDNLPEWVQSKITKALDYIKTANDYMDQERHDADNTIAEKAVSVAQRRAAGIAHAAQKGEIPKKELRGASKEMARMPKGELKKFAKTKETGLPKKVKEADAEAPKEKKSSGGYNFGGGVYESLDRKFKQALTEGMNISVNMNTSPNGEPGKNITISADGEDADKLAALLKMAGIGGHSDAESCDTCGQTPCGCEEELDENSPDWPTNTETSDDALQYSGGLNGPKSTGQTTVPVIASQLRRQVSMEESVKIENDLFRLYQNYKAQ